MDNNSNFSSPEVNLTLTDAVYMPGTAVVPGTYYWRVKVLLAGRESPWSNSVQINSLTLPISLAGTDGLLGDSPPKYITPPIAWQLQHKDTTMLCLDGCSLTGNNAWDRPHTTRGIHGRNYCARASMSMLISYYGGKVSQDRLSYEIFKQGTPEGELGHDLPTTSGQQHTDALAAFLGIVIPTQAGKPTFAQMKTWIDADQPILTRFGKTDGSGHLRVNDGYFEFTLGSTTWQFIHLLDPWDRPKWVNYADDNVTHFWVGPSGPSGAPDVMSEEVDIGSDTDGDGINDFDEKNRFHTVLNQADTDNDLVLDKQEITDYAFNTAGSYDYRDPDMDWDGLRKELDSDNDGGGLQDGCEVNNHTDSFDRSDDMKYFFTTLISPSGKVYTYTPTYKWNAVCGAKSYWLQVDDSTGKGKINQGYTASEAGCASGSGTCFVTPSTPIADGSATWWIDACYSGGCGPWSYPLGFIKESGEALDGIRVGPCYVYSVWCIITTFVCGETFSDLPSYWAFYSDASADTYSRITPQRWSVEDPSVAYIWDYRTDGGIVLRCGNPPPDGTCNSTEVIADYGGMSGSMSIRYCNPSGN